jgi:predicted dehydrogenase
MPEVEIAAFCDRNMENAARRREQYNPKARTYGEVRLLLESERLDFVDILSPPAFHKEHCLLAAEAGVHILCQKPLCDNLADAQSLVAALAGYPRIFAVHENHRYRPWFRRIVELSRQGFFGPLRYLLLQQHDAGEPAEAYKLQAERGILLEYGTHLVDMVRALLGEPARVFASTRRSNPRVHGESWAHVVFECADTTAVIDIAWSSCGPPLGNVVLEGELGSAFYEGTMTRGDASRFRLIRGGKIAADESRSPLDDYVDSFHAFERECADAMLSGSGVIQTARENLKTLACTFAAYAAAESGRAMDLPKFPA